MIKRAHNFTRLITAAFVSAAAFTLSANALENSPAETFFNNSNITDDTSVLLNVFAGIDDLANGIRNNSLAYMANDNNKFTTQIVRDLQKDLEQYRQRYVPQFYSDPLAIDGKLGKRTAELLIAFAQREELDSVFVNTPELGNDDVSMRFLRNTLIDLAPEAYANALQSIAENEIQKRYMAQFQNCASNTPVILFKKPALDDELEKLSKDFDYLSRVVPGICRKDLLKLKAGNRNQLQLDYLHTLYGKALEEKDYCEKKKEPSITSGPFGRCAEFNL